MQERLNKIVTQKLEEYGMPKFKDTYPAQEIINIILTLIKEEIVPKKKEVISEHRHITSEEYYNSFCIECFNGGHNQAIDDMLKKMEI